MSEDLEREIAQLKRRIEELEGKAKPKEPFVPKKPWAPIDYTAGFRLPADAAQAMAKVVPDVKEQSSKERLEHAWSETKGSGPAGFGPPRERWAAAEEGARRRDREAMERERGGREAAQTKERPAADVLGAWRKNNTVGRWGDGYSAIARTLRSSRG